MFAAMEKARKFGPDVALPRSSSHKACAPRSKNGEKAFILVRARRAGIYWGTGLAGRICLKRTVVGGVLLLFLSARSNRNAHPPKGGSEAGQLSQVVAEFGGQYAEQSALGITDDEDAWSRYAFKMATGSGKTKVMSLAIVWSYFHALRENNSPLAKHFVVIAPNLTVFERLEGGFQGRRRAGYF